MLAEFLLERGPPRHQLKSETIVDHREAARRERDALAIGAGDMFALGGRAMREPGLGREFGDRRRPARAGASVLRRSRAKMIRCPCRRARPSSTR